MHKKGFQKRSTLGSPRVRAHRESVGNVTTVGRRVRIPSLRAQRRIDLVLERVRSAQQTPVGRARGHVEAARVQQQLAACKQRVLNATPTQYSGSVMLLGVITIRIPTTMNLFSI